MNINSYKDIEKQEQISKLTEQIADVLYDISEAESILLYTREHLTQVYLKMKKFSETFDE